MGYMLTAKQILGLYREKKLHATGIREFAKKFEAVAKK
jgi:hypothetical protein